LRFDKKKCEAFLLSTCDVGNLQTIHHQKRERRKVKRFLLFGKKAFFAS
jgi:hypothetical protein